MPAIGASTTGGSTGPPVGERRREGLSTDESCLVTARLSQRPPAAPSRAHPEVTGGGAGSALHSRASVTEALNGFPCTVYAPPYAKPSPPIAAPAGSVASPTRYVCSAPPSKSETSSTVASPA